MWYLSASSISDTFFFGGSGLLLPTACRTSRATSADHRTPAPRNAASITVGAVSDPVPCQCAMRDHTPDDRRRRASPARRQVGVSWRGGVEFVGMWIVIVVVPPVLLNVFAIAGYIRASIPYACDNTPDYKPVYAPSAPGRPSGARMRRRSWFYRFHAENAVHSHQITSHLFAFVRPAIVPVCRLAVA